MGHRQKVFANGGEMINQGDRAHQFYRKIETLPSRIEMLLGRSTRYIQTLIKKRYHKGNYHSGFVHSGKEVAEIHDQKILVAIPLLYGL